MKCQSPGFTWTALLRLWIIFWIGCLAAVPSPAADPPPAPEIRQLRQEIEQIRLEYEHRLQALEDRLKQLEHPAAPGETEPIPTGQAPANPPPSPETGPAAPAADGQKDYTEELFRPPTETRQLVLAEQKAQFIRQRMEDVLQNYMDISGYIRAGYGRDSEGGPQPGFIAPGAMAKGRLGNESENYGELAFGKNFYLPGVFSLDGRARADGTPADPVARCQIRLSMYNPYQSYLASDGTSFGLAEAWAAIGNLSASQPAMKFWAGNRFYRRHDIHIDDFYFFNMSGGGGGVEDIRTRLGKVAVAWIGQGSQSAFSDLPQPDPQNKAGFNKANFILSLYDTPLGGGKAEFGLTVTRASSGRDPIGESAPTTTGVAFTFIHTSDGWTGENGSNKLSVQYGRNAAKTFTSGFETYTTPAGTFIRPDASGSYRFRVTESLVMPPSPHFSGNPVVVYQFTDYKEYGGVEQWFSAGVRAVYHFNRHLGLAAEPFLDWTENRDARESGCLFKITLAPQVSLGNLFFSRPAIRAYLTYARWSDAYIGQIGGLDYANRNDGFVMGVQMETWW